MVLVMEMESGHHVGEGPLGGGLQVEVAVPALLYKVPGQETPGDQLVTQLLLQDDLITSPLQYSTPLCWHLLGSLGFTKDLIT